MGIFPNWSRFFRRRDRAPATQAQALERPQKTASVIFIDLPNMVLRSRSKSYPHLMRWDQLRMKISTLVKGTDIFSAFAYNEDDHFRAYRPIRTEDIKSGFEAAGYELRPHHKSVDPIISVDMLEQATRVIASQHYAKLRIVIASGDGDFAYAIRRIRSLYARSIKIEVTVVCWKDSLSPDLRDQAIRIVFLDNVPRILKVPANKLQPAASLT